jgi:hypothetical protein
MNTWTKFWWWNAGTTWPTTVKDVLEKVYGTCKTEEYCFQRLPVWTTEKKTELLAVDSLGTIYQWKFNPKNPTAHAVWLALHDHHETAATKVLYKILKKLWGGNNYEKLLTIVGFTKQFHRGLRQPY